MPVDENGYPPEAPIKLTSGIGAIVGESLMCLIPNQLSDTAVNRDLFIQAVQKNLQARCNSE